MRVWRSGDVISNSERERGDSMLTMSLSGGPYAQI